MARAPSDLPSPVVDRKAHLPAPITRRLGRFTCAVILLAVAACTDGPTPVGPTAQQPGDASALRIPASGTYTDLSVRDQITCAVRSDGVVQCWGDNLWGAAPASRTALAGSFVQVSTSGVHTCATRSDGVVECWGRTQDDEAPSVVTPPSGASFVAVAAGNGYTCALRNDSVVQCWGLDDGRAPPAWTGTSGPFTALAVGSRTCGLTSVGIIECIGSTAITLTPSSGTFVKVMVGSVAICGLRTDGVVQCHGPVPAGFVFPDGTFIDYDVDLASPSAVGAYTCGVRPDGTVACFGDNTDGRAPATRTAATGSFLRVATGWYHACALRTDGGIECWGNPFATAVDHVLPTATFSAPASVIVGQDIALSLSGAQVPGYPSATSFTYAFDCGSGFGSASTVATTNCPTSTAGSVTVKGRVIDQDLDGATYTATVTVKSAAQGTSDLSTEISTAPLAPDIRKALLAKLSSALKAIAEGKTKAACSALNDFINQVNAQSGKAISVDTANAWIDTARQLQTAIGC
jgi:hypothetical protein